MVRLRYSLVGRKGQRLFHIIAIDSRRKRNSGKNLDLLGSYNTHTKELKLDKEKVKKWINLGAQPSDSLKQLLIKKSVL